MTRAVCALCAVIALAGCGIPIATPGGPEYRYSWVMLHDWNREGIQVGPKYDADGAHWSVYWWISCNGPCEHEGYIKGAPLTPGSVHGYQIVQCAPLVFCPEVDGQIVARVPLPYYPPLSETGSEITTN